MLAFELPHCFDAIDSMTGDRVDIDDKDFVDRSGRDPDAAPITPSPVAEVLPHLLDVVAHSPIQTTGCMILRQPRVFFSLLHASREHKPATLLHTGEPRIKHRIFHVVHTSCKIFGRGKNSTSSQ